MTILAGLAKVEIPSSCNSRIRKSNGSEIGINDFRSEKLSNRISLATMKM